MGIDPAGVEVLGFLPEVHTVEYSLLVVPVVGKLPPDPTFTPSEREVSKVLTPLVSDLADEAGWSHQLWNGRRVWFYEIDGEILWGATAWMTRNLLGLET